MLMNLSEAHEQCLAQLLDRMAAEPVKGFLSSADGSQLFRAVLALAPAGPCAEIGSYCGKSTVFLASACRLRQSLLMAVDHHRGSEEHQLGEAYHDAELRNASGSGIDTLPHFRRTLAQWDLEPWVMPLVCPSAQAARGLTMNFALVFIDGGHSPAMVAEDCDLWVQRLLPGGILAVHDVFERPEEGGQGPYLAVQALLAQGRCRWLAQYDSLVFLQALPLAS